MTRTPPTDVSDVSAVPAGEGGNTQLPDVLRKRVADLVSRQALVR